MDRKLRTATGQCIDAEEHIELREERMTGEQKAQQGAQRVNAELRNS